ncbi:MAG TPA: hypothetical protein VKS20_03795 [Candidatus Acidoferrales bacterium]|nr:hypothetical protein [Candidatus Acidoferrales bacterium]
MTIAAGILCQDGMVLCADTEETITEGRKAQASKLRMWQIAYPLDSNCDAHRDIRITIGLAGAGHSDWIAAFIQGIDHHVVEDVPDDFNVEIFEKRLKEYTEQFFLKYIRAYAENPDHRPQAYMLVLAQFPKVRAIYRVHENLVLKTEDENFFLAVGAGAPVFQNLMRLLLGDCPAYRLPWTMDEMVPLVTYVMDKVKSEVPGCGGNSHIMKIGKDWEHEDIPIRRIKELEIQQTDIEREMYRKFAEKLMQQARE